MAELAHRFDLTRQPAVDSPTRDTVIDGLRDADAVICTLAEQIDAKMIAGASRLRVIANYAVGYNNIDLNAARSKGIIVTNTPDVLTESTADLTWALMLTAARRIVEGHELVRQRKWKGWEPTQLLGTDLFDRTLGIIGMGRIGQAVARRAQGFGMSVLYHSRSAKDFSYQQSWTRISLREVLTRADFLTLHVPLTQETHHLIGAQELQLMPPSAYLINVSRGAVVDEAALVRALQEGRLAGAALDVYEQEPALHPGLFDLANVVTLPHLGSATRTTRVRMGRICLENISAVMNGQPAPNRVG